MPTLPPSLLLHDVPQLVAQIKMPLTTLTEGHLGFTLNFSDEGHDFFLEGQEEPHPTQAHELQKEGCSRAQRTCVAARGCTAQKGTAPISSGFQQQAAETLWQQLGLGPNRAQPRLGGVGGLSCLRQMR